MEDFPEGSVLNEVVEYTRAEIFFIIKDVMKANIEWQQRAIAENCALKTGDIFKIDVEGTILLKLLLREIYRKFLASSISIKKFFNNNIDWLSSSITIKNAYAKQMQKWGKPRLALTDSNYSDQLSTNSKQMGRPSKEFEAVSARTVRVSALSGIRELQLVHTTGSQQITTMSPSKLGGYKAALQLTAKPPEQQMSGTYALSVIVDEKLTRQQYLSIRHAALNHNSKVYPPYDRVLEAKTRCYPSDIVITETSAEVKLQSLLDHTCRRVLEVQAHVISMLNSETVGSITLLFKWGFDGSSGHDQYKQQFSDENSSDSNVLLTSLVPLQLLAINSSFEKETVVWKNPRPSYPRLCRPIRLQFLHEDVQSTLNDQKQHIEDQITSLVPLKTVTIYGQNVMVNYEMIFSMVDGKVCNAVTQTKSSMCCCLCKATSEQFNDIDAMKKKPVDVPQLQLGLSTLHAWICFFECLLHVGYKLEREKWQARSVENEEILNIRKLEIQKAFKDKLHLIIDRPKPGLGNTNDGNTARRFFQNSSESAKILGVDEAIVHRFHVILQVLSGGFDINVPLFDKYCLETAKRFVEKYPWFYMSTTVHKVLIHGAKIIDSAVLPFGQLSEEAQEARNEDIRKYREDFSQKCSQVKTMENIFKRLLISSDPVISSMTIMQPKKGKSLSPEAMELLLSSHGEKNLMQISNLSWY